eukprot:gb/GEZN01003799.1/.p1 GENE.gb/GEZN01003799.1/~~gb/GEZN01003799.1/.p1  ORF type:complete len:511 (+),score=80.16 gb/GEZN01003799.1/:179-1534(+)
MVMAGWSAIKVLHSGGAADPPLQAFEPKQGIEQVLVKPGPLPGGLAAVPACLPRSEILCVFCYEGDPAIQKLASATSQEKAWLYGARMHHDPNRPPVPTSKNSHVLKGHLLCWDRDKFDLVKADKAHAYELSKQHIEATRRGVVEVVKQDGSSQQAYWYFTRDALIPGIIVGGGRMGQVLASANVKGDILFRRDDMYPKDPKDLPPGPIFITARNFDLAHVVNATPPSRRKDLIFMQNGYLQDFLDARGLGGEEQTQSLIYFAVANLGERPVDGTTTTNPEGLTAVTGKWAHAMADRLNAIGLACHVYNRFQYRPAMFENLIGVSAFHLIGVQHPDEAKTLGDVAKNYAHELIPLIQELVVGTEKLTGVKLKPGAAERLLAYGHSVAHFPIAVKEFEWRNGYFYKYSQAASRATPPKPDPFPMHTRLLKNIKASTIWAGWSQTDGPDVLGG